MVCLLRVNLYRHTIRELNSLRSFFFSSRVAWLVTSRILVEAMGSSLLYALVSSHVEMLLLCLNKQEKSWVFWKILRMHVWLLFVWHTSLR